MNLASHIKTSEALIQWMDSRIDEPRIPLNSRFRMAAGCLAAAREHQKAIVLLVAQSLHGSAFALARPLLEAYVRGAWLHQCATDEDLKIFESGRFNREHPFASLVADLETLDAFSSGVLSAVTQKSWDALCGYTHTGFHQVVRQNTESFIEPNYEEAELLEVLNFADGIGIMAAVEIAHLASDDYLAVALLEKAKANVAETIT
jgi:hypothetical protein